MKRLLTYLFLVLGLGLVFSNPVLAKNPYHSCVVKYGESVYIQGWLTRQNCLGYAIIYKNNKKLLKRIIHIIKGKGDFLERGKLNESSLWYITININDQERDDWHYFLKNSIGLNFVKINKSPLPAGAEVERNGLITMSGPFAFNEKIYEKPTQIAKKEKKKEPTQTQQVAKKKEKKKEKKVAKKKLYIKIQEENEYRIKIRTEMNIIYSDAEKFAVVHCAKYNKSILFLGWERFQYNKGKVWTFVCANKLTQIAKKEPKKKEKKVAKKEKKKTQQVAKKNYTIYKYSCINADQKNYYLSYALPEKCKKNYTYLDVDNGTVAQILPSFHKLFKNFTDLTDYPTSKTQTQQVAKLKSKKKKSRSTKVEKDRAKRLLEQKLARTKVTKDQKLKAEKERKIEEAKKAEVLHKKQTQLEKLKARFIKPKDKIIMEDVVKLASYQPIKEIPEGMAKKLGKACKVLSCQSKKAGQYVYKVFVKSSKMGQQRNPGNMIYGMAMYEIMYLQKLRTAERSIKRYINKGGPEGYTSAQWTFKSADEGKIRSVVKMNKGREKMRAALGMDINLPIETVLKRYWLLGDFLNEGKIKVKKAKLDPDIKKRKALLVEYRTALNKLKKKIEENENL